ncbi:MAG: TetR/AcrR family transcriptional regulator [Deltaproteobacteria bacterium]|nr:TetR/AcrR family transcriptional regulator [Deltaproteobacteria bacterium]
MRIKDEEKNEALFEATVKVVNRIGFASSSVSKISEAAGLSPATLYTYHKNKEELLISTYLNVKRKLSETAFENVDDEMPLRDVFRQIWFNSFRFTAQHPDYFQYSEQFANSPFYKQIDQNEIDRFFTPIASLIRKGIERKIIKNVEVDIVAAFIFYPVIILANPRLCRNFVTTDEEVDRAFQLAWDAIKL